MKRFFYLCRASAMYVFFVCACLSVVCCSNDDDDDAVIGGGNTVDMAVTGGVSDITLSTAIIKGYINVDQTLAMLIQDFGIEYSTDANFDSYYSDYAKVSGYTGREFSVELFNLDPSTTYYYRTYVHQISGMYYYGKTLSFTTKAEAMELAVDNVSYTQAVVSYAHNNYKEATFYYSTKADGPFAVYEYWDDRYEWYNTISPGDLTIKGLEPGTTYYCYLISSGNKSETVSFTTKSLPFDLSGTSVQCSYKPEYNSYKDWYGSTVDLTWLGGTYTVNITSNVGNQYKYGILAAKTGSIEEFNLFKTIHPDENFLFYSTNTSSPYKVQVTCWAGAHVQIESLLSRVKEGEASVDDYDELAYLLKELRYGGAIYPYIQAFIEIDGEQIYIGSIYSLSTNH